MSADVAELLRRAASECAECGAPIVRVERVWEATYDDGWKPVDTTVCPQGHRAPLEPLVG